MKKLVLLFLALFAFSLASFTQEPVEKKKEVLAPTHISPPQNSLLFNRFPNGSVPYPSPEAQDLLSRMVGRKRVENIPEDRFSDSYQMALSLRSERAVFKKYPPEEECKAARILIPLIFIPLRLMAGDCEFDSFYYHNFHMVHQPPYYGNTIWE